MDAVKAESAAEKGRRYQEERRARAADDKAKRRRLIQDVTRGFVREHGVRWKIEQVAAACRLSVGGIYLYFTSKDDLMVSLLEDLRLADGSIDNLKLVPSNYFEVLLRAASSDVQNLSDESKQLLRELAPLLGSVATFLGEELLCRVRAEGER